MRGPYRRRAAPHALTILLASAILAIVAWSGGYLEGARARPPLTCPEQLQQAHR